MEEGTTAYSPQKYLLCPVHIPSIGKDGQLGEVIRRNVIILVATSIDPRRVSSPLSSFVKHFHAPLTLIKQLLQFVSKARSATRYNFDDAGHAGQGQQQEIAFGGVGRQREAHLGEKLLDELDRLYDHRLRKGWQSVDEGEEVGVQEARRADDLQDPQHDFSLKVVLEDSAEDLQRLLNVVC